MSCNINISGTIYYQEVLNKKTTYTKSFYKNRKELFWKKVSTL